jgi:hypothetical protein
MRKLLGFAVVALLLSGCTMVATVQSPDEAWSPSALVRWHEARCENEAARATPSPQAHPSFSVRPAEADVSRDIRSRVYYS